MTRINVVPVSELHNKHLLAEYRELPRVFTLAKKAKPEAFRTAPSEYTLGTGHVKFFYSRLMYLVNRYIDLTYELKYERGYNVKPISVVDLIDGVDYQLLNNYTPTPQAIKINRQRIEERLKEMKI